MDKDEKLNDFNFNKEQVNEFQKPNFDKDGENKNKKPVDPIVSEEEKSINNKLEVKKPNKKNEKPIDDKDEKSDNSNFISNPIKNFPKSNFDKDFEFNDKEPVDPSIFEENKPMSNKPEFEKPINDGE